MSFAELMADHNRLHEKHTKLRAAIHDYHQVRRDIYTFLNNYLSHGGDPTTMPAHWHKMDAIREEKYQAMLKLAGLTS